MSGPICNGLLDKMSQWGTEFIYKALDIKSPPQSCTISVMMKDHIEVWPMHDGNNPRKVVDISEDGTVSMQDNCEYRDGAPEKYVVKIKPGCKATEFQKIGSVNPKRFAELVKAMMLPGRESQQIYLNAPPSDAVKNQPLPPLQLPPPPAKKSESL